MIKKNTPLKQVLKIGEKCKKCGHCCSYSSGFATEEDITKIAIKLGMTEAELKEKYFEESEKYNTKMLRPKTIKKDKPYGKCIFLKDNLCSIQDVKPMQCRISTCAEEGDKIIQWLDLNFFVNPKDAQSVREYACTLTVREPIEGGKLHEIVTDKKKLKEMLTEEK